MKQPITTDIIYIYKVKNWLSIKSILKSVVEDTLKTHRNEGQLNDYYSDRGNRRNYTNDIIKVLTDTLKEVTKDLKVENLAIQDCWTVSYKEGGFQSPHAHQESTFSACLYLDLTNNQKGTRFILSNYSAETKGTLLYTPSVEEGSLIVFPSHLLHFTTPNLEEKEKTTICFDIKI